MSDHNHQYLPLQLSQRPPYYVTFTITSDHFLQLFLYPGTRPYPSPLEPPWLTLIGGEKLHQLSNKDRDQVGLAIGDVHVLLQVPLQWDEHE